MAPLSDDATERRVLILAPTGRDADMMSEQLAAGESLQCTSCQDVDRLVQEMRRGAGAVVVAQEGLNDGGTEPLLSALDAQEHWSDLPILLLTFPLSRRAPHAHPAVALLERANVMLLQRPLPVPLFLSAVRSAVRARRRQYQIRDLHHELERAVQLGELFASILGHDLRTPLAAIKLSADAIVRGSQDPAALRPAGRILNSAERMARMIEQLLDFARVRQGSGIELQLRPAHLDDIARPVLQEIEAANPHATIEVRGSGDLSGEWDPDRLAQVLSNLAANAVQHGTRGTTTTVELEGTDGGLVRARVRNFGTISSDVLPTLFEPFRRTASSATRERGLGLGLFIAREIVRAHGGDISVRTPESDLTVFEVILPRRARPVPTGVVAAK
ncbi:sensor histidine kinase KdpD [Anaeromyxobacter sp. Fw109-5]|uniref:sensor histidine kinase n=1 Tax=Anaeromyxobacter sp. (strain Fw109-5) TaxID=404589 RepID=UPI0000ED8A2E|nr:HAMP domain-containing sensor histidine kinase [Anaeromyxobacter sp. Fw109-5]ABS27423.1 histidine kinase [Anaeromyxobacter sp. Fw109-5]